MQNTSASSSIRLGRGYPGGKFNDDLLGVYSGEIRCIPSREIHDLAGKLMDVPSHSIETSFVPFGLLQFFCKIYAPVKIYGGRVDRQVVA
jgi:hypothetical protein